VFLSLAFPIASLAGAHRVPIGEVSIVPAPKRYPRSITRGSFLFQSPSIDLDLFCWAFPFPPCSRKLQRLLAPALPELRNQVLIRSLKTPSRLPVPSSLNSPPPPGERKIFSFSPFVPVSFGIITTLRVFLGHVFVFVCLGIDPLKGLQSLLPPRPPDASSKHFPHITLSSSGVWV